MKRIVIMALGVFLTLAVASPMASGQTSVSNLPPTIDSFIGDETATEGQPKTYTINASDPDNTSLDYSLSVVSGDAAVVFGGNTATPTVRFHFPGTVVLRASVSDGVNPAVTQNKTVKVVSSNPPANTAPSLNLPAYVTAEATSAAGATVTYSASASDPEDGPLNPHCTPATGSTFALGSTQVNCSVTDSAGLSDSGTFTVTVKDNTAPDISGLPQDITEEATGPDGARVSWQAPSATDVVDGNVNVECSPASGTIFGLGQTTVSCTATDSRGNTNSKTFSVTVNDTTAPAISDLSSNITKVATSASGANVTYTSPTATDLVDGAVNVSCQPASGSTFSLGETTVSCSATDSRNNTAAKSFKVNVNYAWSGVLQPINGGNTLNNTADDTSVFKLGSTIPVKFKLTGDSVGITDATARIILVKLDGTPDGTELEAISTNAPDSGSSFRYDPTSAQYIFNLGTKSLTAGDYLIKIDLGDGTAATNTVRFSLKK